MICKVTYFKTQTGTYSGREYTYRTDLPIAPGTKVMAPTSGGPQKAMVTQVNLPESVIDERWADAVKTITELDAEG